MSGRMIVNPRDVYVHIHPKSTQYHGLHETNLGPECWCEPVVALRMDPTSPKQSIYVVIHNHDLIDVTLVGPHRPPPPFKTFEGK